MGHWGGQGALRDVATQQWRGHDAARRYMVRSRGFSMLALIVVAMTAAGCSYKPTIRPSEGHINAEQFPPKAVNEKILPPVTVSEFVPPPKPLVKVPTYSVVVQEVPVKELLFALSRDTKQNIDVHPGIQGLVTLNAIDETLPAILERIAQQINLRYRTEGRTIIVVPDTPYFKTYRINYVNMSRDTASSMGVSGEISGSSVGAAGQSGGGQGTSGTSNTKVDTKSNNNFWEVLRQNVESILAASKALTQSADQRAERAEAELAAREERIAQAEAVSRAGPNAASLFSTAFGQSRTVPSDTKNDIVVNSITGTVTVLGNEKQHVLIQQYLDSVTSASQRQVLIEATIAEVTLSDRYQAGVDWSRIATGTGFTFEQQLIGPTLGTPPSLVVGYTNTNQGISASLALLEQFGNTRVLSSPKLMAINNQTALLKVVDNVVYFEVQTTAGTATAGGVITAATTNTIPKTVPVGLVMSVLPQITESGTVNLTVRPTISRVIRFVTDPNPALKFDKDGQPLLNAVPNLIPQIEVREMESVLQAGSGQTIILGGLMRDDVTRLRDAVPGLGRLPSPVGDAFSFRDDLVVKTELVIFLKPTVIRNPSLDSDELKFLQRFLPVVDKTGKNP
ncbi:MAG: secretin N-terminal domain-containing protein [Burkholderiales bacterium]